MLKLKKNLFQKDGWLSQSFGGNESVYGQFSYIDDEGKTVFYKGHNGIDYAIPTGRELYSCIHGICIESIKGTSGYGNYIKIENNECGVLYGHLKELHVKVGDSIQAGQIIGLSNNTGFSTGSHLHFGVFLKPRNKNNGYNGYIDPLNKKLVEWVDVLEDTTQLDLIEALKSTAKYYKTEKEKAEKDAENKEIEIGKINGKLDIAKTKIIELEARIRQLAVDTGLKLTEHLNAIIDIVVQKVVEALKGGVSNE